MITSTMTSKEMYDNLVEDRTKINIKIEYLRSKAIKELKKARKFPACVIYNYKIPATNNEHIIYFYAETRYSVNSPIADSFFSLFCNQHRYIITYSKAGHISDNKLIAIKQINAYTSHFFDRYNERFLKNDSLSRNEIISHYLSRNKYAFPIEINEKINRNYKKYGVTGQLGRRVRDGFCFICTIGQGCICIDKDSGEDMPEAIAIVYKTYNNELNMPASQTTAIKEGQEVRRKYLNKKLAVEGRDEILKLLLKP